MDFYNFIHLESSYRTSSIGHLFNFEIPVFTVFSLGTEGFRKQVIRARARVCVCVCVCVYARLYAYRHNVHHACRFEGWSKVAVKGKYEARTHATPTTHACKPLTHTHAHTLAHASARKTCFSREKKDNQRQSVNEIKKLPLWLLCDISSNIKDLTKFGSKIQEADTSHFE